MTEILFIRHGETDCNKKHLYYGHLNPSLNETGINQLKNTKKKLEKMNEKINIIFSSDLKRCRESLELLEIDKNIKQHFSENLRELNFGILEGKTYKEIENQFPHYVNEMKNNWRNFKAEGGESLSDLQKRSAKEINKIKNEYKNKKILVVAHAGVIQSLISYYLFNNLDGYWKFRLDNGSITKMTVMNDGFIYFNYINK
ncbi:MULTISPECIES: histidine phosphatase family protein [unclassified Leptotrichia]|uniref:histidine phosphatase family protein n=1 Tax=unclassified Leptotrichia TaxID=2633022 RepID=UPI0003AE2CED|nr:MULTISPECIES: histidine phosphatase family protein [unclassified Leptotrichia]ERL25601.1 phosphoglycerate mutase family protein [Leptotrichia sp. oral taxon 225 str. F0581]WLD74659.1 histidine phosphatase family protein [Leptotrichia sp. HMT-225]